MHPPTTPASNSMLRETVQTRLKRVRMIHAAEAAVGKCPQCGASLATGALAGLCLACLLHQGGVTAGFGVEPEELELPPSAELARLFPQLEIHKLIARGGMGAVYRARQPALDRVVALKILSRTAGDAEFEERFEREARALARLSHPNIVAVHDFGQADGVPFFIMEFVDGLNLRQLQQAGRLAPREALQIIPQICDALQFAHDEGVVHRDIKPENLLLDRKGRVKIADFGLAKILGVTGEQLHLTREGQTMGTPHYMAPEQVEHPREVDHRADIYSLGVVFYELLTGELPLGRFQSPSSRMSATHLDARLDEVVLRALAKSPEQRYQQASQVKSAVETIANTPHRIGGRNAAVPLVAVKTPAVCLMLIGGANLLILVSLLLAAPRLLVGSAEGMAQEIPIMIIPVVPLFALASALMVYGGHQMMRLSRHGLAVTASNFAILVPPGLLIGVGVGIWSLIVLGRPDVREAFGRTPRPPSWRQTARDWTMRNFKTFRAWSMRTFPLN
jgi:predicted Ser/Thr protein kinase